MQVKPFNPDQGFVSYCGIITDKAEAGECIAHCTLEEKHLNPWGIAHGGLLFTLLDTSAGKAVRSLSNNTRNTVTLSSNVNFIRQAKPGMIIAKARVIKDGKTIAIAESDIFDEEGTLLARAGFEFFYI